MKTTICLAIWILGCIHGVQSFSINEMMKGDTTTLYTPSTYGYNYFWLELYVRDYIVFSVRACSDVHVALTALRADFTSDVTEVVLGGWFNTRSVIRNGVNEQQTIRYLDIATPELLHCVDYRTFWIQWGLHMRVGLGPIPGEQIFMELERAPNITHRISYVSFSTGYDFTGKWKLQENQGHYLIVDTPDDFRYQYLWKSVEYKNNYFGFRVRACSDAHINLSPQEGVTLYEVVLGGWSNSRSVIRYSGAERTEYLEQGILACNGLRFFWIGWEGGNIRVGKGGDVGTQVIMNVTVQQFSSINFVSVSSGYGSIAKWTFNDNLENGYKYFVNSSGNRPTYEVFATVSWQNYVIFEAMACSDIWVALCPYNGAVEEFSHQIYIGSENNTKSGVIAPYVTNPLVEVSTPKILICLNPGWFWVSWYNGTGRVGTGYMPGFNEFMSWNLSALVVNSVGFAGTHSNGGYIFARKTIADSIVVYTSQALTRRQMWVTVRQEVMFKFRIMACHSVYITLSGLMDVPDVQTYEIVIGACYTTVIRNRIQNDADTLARVDSPDILSCNQFRSFWISWIDGYIRLGKGESFGMDEVLQLAEKKPHPINAINVATYGVFGDWRMESDSGDYLDVQNGWGDLSTKWFLLHPWVNWFYFQLAGSAGHVVLATRYQDQVDVYNVYIGATQNTEMSLWKDGVLLQQKLMTNILDVSDFRNFWVGWENGRIRVGTSRHRYEFTQLDYVDPKPFRVTAMGLKGDRGAFSRWRIWENFASEMSLSAYLGEAWWSVRHRTSFLFELKTCSRAEVILSATMHDYFYAAHVYVVAINDWNNMTGIWRGYYQRKLTELVVPETQKCNISQVYWLSWHDGHIALGLGREKGKRSIVSYQDMDASPVTALTLSTIGGTWRIPLTFDEFQVIPAARNVDALSVGEISGAALAGTALLVVFIVLLIAIIAPATLASAWNRIRGGAGNESTATSFDNPVAVEFPEMRLS